MCQLAAYIGDRTLAKTLLDSLRLQEAYIGAHATGLATITKNKIRLIKGLGPVDEVIEKTDIYNLTGFVGIAHSRYITDPSNSGEYNTVSAGHPWVDDKCKIVLMHNGLIKNHRLLYEMLKKRHTFQSYIEELDCITDSEVAVHLLTDELSNGVAVPDALRNVAQKLTGLFLLCVMHVDHPETIWIANWLMPCYIALGEEEAMFSSSRIGLNHVKNEMSCVFQPPKNSIIELGRGQATISTLDPTRKVPDLKLNVYELSRCIIDVLDDVGETPLLPLTLELFEKELHGAFGLTQKEWEDLRDAGFGDSNYVVEALDMLASEGKVRILNEVRTEYGVEVPRTIFSLADDVNLG